MQALKVYFMRMGDTELVKVGSTRDNMSERVSSLQTGNPYVLHVERSFTASQDDDEFATHHLLSRLKFHGGGGREWFVLSKTMVKEIVDKIYGGYDGDGDGGVEAIGELDYADQSYFWSELCRCRKNPGKWFRQRAGGEEAFARLLAAVDATDAKVP